MFLLFLLFLLLLLSSLLLLLLPVAYRYCAEQPDQPDSRQPTTSQTAMPSKLGSLAASGPSSLRSRTFPSYLRFAFEESLSSNSGSSGSSSSSGSSGNSSSSASVSSRLSHFCTLDWLVGWLARARQGPNREPDGDLAPILAIDID